MIRAALYTFAFHVALIVYAIGDAVCHLLTAPHSGFDRAGDGYNGHPAPDRRQREGAGRSGERLAKGGNGALHFSGGKA